MLLKLSFFVLPCFFSDHQHFNNLYFLLVNNIYLHYTTNSCSPIRCARNVVGTGARPPSTASARSTNWWTSTSLPPPPPPPRSVRRMPLRSRRHRGRQKRTLSCCNSRQTAVTTAMKSPNIGQISCRISPTILFDDDSESRRCHVFCLIQNEDIL
jgi:hypothetical protein